jgi:hypothetical protein
MLLLVELGPKWLFLPHPTPLIASLPALLGLKLGTPLEVFLRLIVKGWTTNSPAPYLSFKFTGGAPYLSDLSRSVHTYIVIPARTLYV